MATNKGNNLGKILKQRRLWMSLTLVELAAKSGVSVSHLGRIEGGERFPSAHVLGKLAKPLGLGEAELFTLAGYLSPQTSTTETESLVKLDRGVVKALASQPAEVQQAVIGILNILKSLARAESHIGFAEYAHRNYPELDEDIITMIEDILEHPQKAKQEEDLP